MRYLALATAVLFFTASCASESTEDVDIQTGTQQSEQTEQSPTEAETQEEQSTEPEAFESESEMDASDPMTDPAEQEQQEAPAPQMEQESAPEPEPEPTTEPEPTPEPEPAPEPTPEPAPEPEPEVEEPAGYTMAQVAENDSASSCWSAINGTVYDLTNWISQHPGGSSRILGLCGKDGSSSFNAMHGGQSNPESRLAGFALGPLS